MKKLVCGGIVIIEGGMVIIEGGMVINEGGDLHDIVLVITYLYPHSFGAD